jgi:hypothetical protein
MLVGVCLHGVVALAQTTAQPPPADQAQPSPYTETVDVVGATPIHGLGVPRAKMPGNVQTATGSDLARTPGIHAGGQLMGVFGSVHVNETQANPFQPDLQFRGFAVSPLLGLPQGLAVYQDGVRLNEPFGDTVNWDLIPAHAIASVNLMPGSNPLFGLNALGGAISLQTKTGSSHPGHAVSLLGGSFGRVWADVQSGGHRGGVSYFVAGRVLAEDGWRDFSPSRVRQLFGNVEWQGASSTLTASVTGGANRLVGNGPAPVQLLDERRDAIFTHPDETRTQMALLSLRGRHAVSPDVSLDAVLFYRPSTVHTINGDGTEYGARATDRASYIRTRSRRNRVDPRAAVRASGKTRDLPMARYRSVFMAYGTLRRRRSPFRIGPGGPGRVRRSVGATAAERSVGRHRGR